jgi:glycosyltransferase involved in cell wall biosynthesis
MPVADFQPDTMNTIADDVAEAVTASVGILPSTPMRIAIISDWFAEKMGYAENCLPKALAALGHDVHLITSNAQIYFDSPTYRETYEPFIGPPIVECGTKQLDGYTLHRLPHGRWTGKHWKNRLYIQNLVETLSDIRPDIVQTFDLACPSTYQAARAQMRLRYKLFLETHTHASVFNPAAGRKSRSERLSDLKNRSLNWFVSNRAVRCYPISADSAEIAVGFYGIDPSKIEVCSLGIDTDLFSPWWNEEPLRERLRLRDELGFASSDIVCVYTGRLTRDKSPIILAQAVHKLASQGLPFRGLFVGSGTAVDIEEISSCAGCTVQPFVPVRDLPPYYWASDIGVWPKQESTSQLDAAACGLPIIISNRTHVNERIEGNGLTYIEGDVDDLASQLVSLADYQVRRDMGEHGSRKMGEHFSWLRIARQRAGDYQAALGR